MTDQWIPVTEKLPNDGEAVMIWIDGADHPIQAYINTDGLQTWHADYDWRDFTNSGEIPRDTKISGCFDVTHWMPLPEPPKTTTP